MENTEKFRKEIPIGTVEYTERHLSAQSLVVMILALSLFLFSFFFYLRNQDPLLLVIIMVCLQFFFKYLDNIPSRIWKLYHHDDEDE